MITAIWEVFLREIRLISKDHSLILTLLLAPIFYAFFYGSIYSNKEEQNVLVVVVDEDNSVISRAFIEQISNLQVTAVEQVKSINEAREYLNYGKAQGILYIESGLSARIQKLQQTDVLLVLNAARFLPSSDLTAAVSKIALTVGAGVRLEYLKKTEGVTNTIARKSLMPVNLDYRPLFNERSSYGAFLLPGLLALILQQTLLIGISGSMSGEREKKRLTSWFNTAGENLSSALIGKGLFYFILYCLYALFFFVINFYMLNLPIRGNSFSIALLVILFIMTIIPFGLLLGSFFRSQALNIQIMAFSTYPLFLLSGYTWPFTYLPKPLQWLSNGIPTTPFLKAYTGIVQTGSSLYYNLSSLLHLSILMVVFTLLFFWRLKYLMSNENLKSTLTEPIGEPK